MTEDIKRPPYKTCPFRLNALVAIRLLSVGKLAPEIEGVDITGDVFKLSDYRGKVIMLSFWGHW